MALNVRKRDFLGNVRTVCSEFSRLVHLIQRLADQWDDEFRNGKDNEITQEEIDELEFGITPVKLAKIAQVSDELQNFWNDVAVASQDNKKFIQNLMNGL